MNIGRAIARRLRRRVVLASVRLVLKSASSARLAAVLLRSRTVPPAATVVRPPALAPPPSEQAPPTRPCRIVQARLVELALVEFALVELAAAIESPIEPALVLLLRVESRLGRALRGGPVRHHVPFACGVARLLYADSRAEQPPAGASLLPLPRPLLLPLSQLLFALTVLPLHALLERAAARARAFQLLARPLEVFELLKQLLLFLVHLLLLVRPSVRSRGSLVLLLLLLGVELLVGGLLLIAQSLGVMVPVLVAIVCDGEDPRVLRREGWWTRHGLTMG